MPIINCPNCGEKTNTAVCPGWWDKARLAKCTVRLAYQSGYGNRYVKGCGYDELSDFDKKFADELISEQPGTVTADSAANRGERG
jgi:hypothetical protein